MSIKSELFMIFSPKVVSRLIDCRFFCNEEIINFFWNNFLFWSNTLLIQFFFFFTHGIYFFEGVILKVELFQLMSICWLVTHKAIHFI